MNIFRICVEFQNYHSHSDRCQKRKNHKIKGKGIINRQYITIRELAQFIGNIVTTFETVLTGPLHYKDMETLKTPKLKENKEKFDAKITIN